MRALIPALALIVGSAPAFADVQGFDLNRVQKSEIYQSISDSGVDPLEYAVTVIGGVYSGTGASQLVFCGDLADKKTGAPLGVYAGFFQDGGVGAVQIVDARETRSPVFLMCEMLRENQ